MYSYLDEILMESYEIQVNIKESNRLIGFNKKKLFEK